MNVTGALTPVRKTTAIGVVVLLVALLAAWMLVLSPRSDAIAKVDTETDTAAASNQALRAQITQRRSLEAQLPELRKVSTALDRRFPPTAEQAKLFKMISAAAAAAGIAPQYVTNLTMNPPTATDTGSGASAQLPGVGAPIGAIASQTVTMNVGGSPAQVRKMLANLEMLPRAFAVTLVSLSTQGPAAAAGTTAPVVSGASTQIATITGDMFVMPKVVDPTKSSTTTTS